MDMTLLSRWITYVVFAWIGYSWAKTRPLPVRIVDWLLWLVALLLAGGIKAQLVNIFGFMILSQDLLQGLILGVLIGFLLRLALPKRFEAR